MSEGIFSTWARSCYLDQWTFLYFFVSCDFPLAHFWSVRVTSSAEYEANALKKEIWREHGIQNKIVCFFSVSIFFSKCYRKWRHRKETTTLTLLQKTIALYLKKKKIISCGTVMFFYVKT